MCACRCSVPVPVVQQLEMRRVQRRKQARRACCRKCSLLVHPDRCKHAQAADAFEVLGDAQEELLDDERRESLMRVLEYARDAVREVRRKATKHDSALRIAASLHAEGRQGVEAAWEETEDFHEKWRLKAQDVLARSEFRRRKLTKRCVCDVSCCTHPCFSGDLVAVVLPDTVEDKRSPI